MSTTPRGGHSAANAAEARPGCGLSTAMIRVAGEDGDRPIKLFGQHDTDELMRPGHGPEGETEVGPVEHCPAVTVGAESP